MTTDFDRVPEAFVERYLPEIRAWAVEFRTRGPRCPITLRGGAVGVPALDAHGQPPLLMVVLEAQRVGGRMVVRPKDETNEDLIRRHVEAVRQ